MVAGMYCIAAFVGFVFVELTGLHILLVEMKDVELQIDHQNKAKSTHKMQ